VASNLIPTVLQQLVGKMNDTRDRRLNLEHVLDQLTGGQGLQRLLGSFGQGDGGRVMNRLEGLPVVDYRYIRIKIKLKGAPIHS
jgi:hypothetical protein